MTLETIKEKFDMVSLSTVKIFNNANYVQINDTCDENVQPYYHYVISYNCAKYICDNTDLPVYEFLDLDICVVGVYGIAPNSSNVYNIPQKGYYIDILNAKNNSTDEDSEDEN